MQMLFTITIFQVSVKNEVHVSPVCKLQWNSAFRPLPAKPTPPRMKRNCHWSPLYIVLHLHISLLPRSKWLLYFGQSRLVLYMNVVLCKECGSLLEDQSYHIAYTNQVQDYSRAYTKLGVLVTFAIFSDFKLHVEFKHFEFCDAMYAF